VGSSGALEKTRREGWADFPFFSRKFLPSARFPGCSPDSSRPEFQAETQISITGYSSHFTHFPVCSPLARYGLLGLWTQRGDATCERQ
jgi:hypothetical protein